MIKVMIVEDQIMLAEGVKSVLTTAPDITVCAIAENGAVAAELCAEKRPDVVLMDIRMPTMNGIVATKRLKEICPDAKILILTTFDDSDYILGALNNGACGYLLKDVSSSVLIDSIRNAYNGDTILPSKIARKITDAALKVSGDRHSRLKNGFNLSDREVEIAMMLADGFTNRQIASALKLSDGTCRNYISAIYLKLGVDNRVAAVDKIRAME